MRRFNNAFLNLMPFLAIALAAPQALRIPGVYQAIGGAACLAMVISAWSLGAHLIRGGSEAKQLQALAGALLMVPFALIVLFWVGLGPPWETTPAENRMRYLVLLGDSIAVTAGFTILWVSLQESGERFYSALGFSANLLAGTAYLVWLAFMVGLYLVRVQAGQTAPAVTAMAEVHDVTLSVACLLTYLTTAVFAASLGRARWLGIASSRAFVFIAFVALLLVGARGLTFPDPTAGTVPWYVQPGFIAGIPAVPWIMPHLLGVVLLRRAGSP
jgi:hypothetical protein